MYKRILIALLVLNLIGFSIYLVGSRMRGQSEVAAETRESEAMYPKFKDLISKEDFVKIRHVSRQTMASGTVTDDDLDYLIGLLTKPYPTSKRPAYVHLTAGAVFTALKTYLPNQKEKIFEACIPLLNSKDPYDLSVSLTVAALHGDSRAIPQVLPLLRHEDSRIVKRAQDYLTSVGFSAAKKLK